MSPDKTLNQYHPDMVFHPGETLREKLEELNIGSKELAVRTGKPEQTISKVLNGKSSITPEMALLFETVLNIPARFWMNSQMLYDEYMARHEHANISEREKEWARQFPYPQMARLGWVVPTIKVNEKVNALLNFFKVATVEAWKDVFLEKKLAARFRISLYGSKNPHAISAWLQQGRREAKEVEVAAFDRKLFKSLLPEFRNIMALAEDDFYDQTCRLAARVGIKIVCTPCLPQAPINGVTRWIDDHPVIQMSDRWKRYDIFWFSLFHEFGHILLHPKKYISMENVECDNRDEEKEQEANAFAVKWTFSKREETDFIQQNPQINRECIIDFAERINTHPSMILGRLVHLGIVSHQKAAFFKIFNKIRIE